MRRCSGRGGSGTSRCLQRSRFRFEMLVVCCPKLRTNACTFGDANHQYRYRGNSLFKSERRTVTNPPKVAGSSSLGIQEHFPTKFQLFALEIRMSPSCSKWFERLARLRGIASKSLQSSVVCTFFVRMQTIESSLPEGTTSEGLNVIPRMNSEISPRGTVAGRITSASLPTPSSPSEFPPPIQPASSESPAAAHAPPLRARPPCTD